MDPKIPVVIPPVPILPIVIPSPSPSSFIPPVAAPVQYKKPPSPAKPIPVEKQQRTIYNICGCNRQKTIKAYCKKCKIYLCGDCQITNHFDHEGDVEELAEKCTRFLAEYQKLSRGVSLMADRRQVHIKDQSIEEIIRDIRGKIVKMKELLKNDIEKSTEIHLRQIEDSPLITQIEQRKAELAGKSDAELQQLKKKLNGICRDLLGMISEGKFESADKLLSEEKIGEYEANYKIQAENASGDVDFIHELRRLKQTEVEYTYDPMAVIGMIKVSSTIHRPPRIFQFDREKNLMNLFTLDSKILSSCTLSAGGALPFRFVSVEHNSQIYFSGGDIDSTHYLGNFCLYDELRGGLIPLCSMHEPRSRHAMASCELLGIIYALGGENASGVLKLCEAYKVKENVWYLLPNLNEARCGLSAISIGGSEGFLYAVGGWNSDCIGNIEKLANGLEKGHDNTWEIVKLGRKHTLKGLQLPGLSLNKRGELLIFGGYKDGEKLSEECFALDVKNGTLKKIKNLEEGEAFIASEVKKWDDKIWAFGYEKGGIYSYDEEKDEWTHTPQEKLSFQGKK